MSRKSSQIVTLKAQGKGCSSSHNLPKELSLITERIEKLGFVIKPVGKSKWKPKSASYSRMIDMAKNEFGDVVDIFYLRTVRSHLNKTGKLDSQKYEPVYIFKNNK